MRKEKLEKTKHTFRSKAPVTSKRSQRGDVLEIVRKHMPTNKLSSFAIRRTVFIELPCPLENHSLLQQEYRQSVGTVVLLSSSASCRLIIMSEFWSCPATVAITTQESAASMILLYVFLLKGRDCAPQLETLGWTFAHGNVTDGLFPCAVLVGLQTTIWQMWSMRMDVCSLLT